jgi:hypothetical protein
VNLLARLFARDVSDWVKCRLVGDGARRAVMTRSGSRAPLFDHLVGGSSLRRRLGRLSAQNFGFRRSPARCGAVEAMSVSKWAARKALCATTPACSTPRAAIAVSISASLATDLATGSTPSDPAALSNDPR